MTREEFETLVEEALRELPEEFASRLSNVQVAIEDEPSRELLHEMGLDPRRDSLFGYYRGVPLSERGFAFGNSLPDAITIFFRPLVRAFRSPDRIRSEVRRTVIHEIGHHFGLDDEALRRDGY